MNKYWRIGTGAITYINRFAKLVTDNNLYIKDYFIVVEESNIWVAKLKNGEELETWNSESTANQYLTVWESMGFIYKVRNSYYISTNFRDLEDLIKYSTLNLTSKNISEQTERYKLTLAINILVAGNLLNQYDLQKKNILKGSGPLDIKDVKKSISKYEKEVIKSKEMLKSIKEYYDTKF